MEFMEILVQYIMLQVVGMIQDIAYMTLIMLNIGDTMGGTISIKDLLLVIRHKVQ